MRWLAAVLLIFAFAVGCKQCQPIPDPNWPPDCGGNVGRMLRAENLVYSVYPCYACEFARGCFTEGAQYCCVGSGICSECSEAPIIHFPQSHPDGGSK